MAKRKPQTLKAKRTILDKAAATINRLASGAPKGRKETDDIREVYKRLNSKPTKKSPPVRKFKAGQGALAKRRAATIRRGIKGEK